MNVRARRVALAAIKRAKDQSTIFEADFGADLRAAFEDHGPVVRYGRDWRVSRPSIMDDRYLAAKLGFTRQRDSEEVRFDEAAQDFVTRVSPTEQGSYSHFVVDLQPGVIAFEVRPPNIKKASFMGALRKLLTTSTLQFAVTPLKREMEFHQWAKALESLLAFDGRVGLPNPQWLPRARAIREVMETTNATEVDFKAKSDAPGGLRLEEGNMLDAVVAHAEAGYGQLKATGTSEGESVRYAKGLVDLDVQIHVADADTSTTIFAKLRKALTQHERSE